MTSAAWSTSTTVVSEPYGTRGPAATSRQDALETLTVVDIVVHLVVGDGQVVAVVMGVEPCGRVQIWKD